jgi:hypothetical protein
MLLNRLQWFALEQNDPQTHKPVEMSSDRVRAALGLLRKTMPDLAVTQHTGDPINPIVTSHTVRFVRPDKEPAEEP